MIVGIDLGTTNSLIAYFKDGKAEVIPNRLGKLLTPSIVSVDHNGQILVGDTAKEYGYLFPFATAKVFKRTMGTDQTYNLCGLSFTSEELSSFVLRSLKEDAEVYLKETVDEAIISVPAYFNDNQRKATKKAGELAGLKVSRIISEPTASAVAYGVGDSEKSERCMIFDLGGGTFDVSILEYFKSIIEIHAIAGDNHLGGEDFTMAMMAMFMERIGIKEELLEPVALSTIYKAAEKAKCELGEKLGFAIACKLDEESYYEEFSLDEFKKACEPLLERIRKPIEKCLRDSKTSLDDIDRVILVGGGSRLNLVREFVKEIINIYPEFYIDPDTSVAIGASMQAAMKQRDKSIEEIILTDVCPFTLGTEVVHDNGNFTEPGYFLPIIERNTIIPVSKKERVYTAYENQEHVHIRILQGESRMAKNNFPLGFLDLDVPKGPKGQEAVDITYTYDVNSLLEVEVTVVSTGETKKVIIQNQQNKIPQEEAEERFKVLQYLKQSPREEEENLFAILRGERLYRENVGKNKEMVSKALDEFDAVLASGTRLEIERTRKKMIELFDDIEHQEESILYS